MEKEHLEVILEDINSKFKLVLEGHVALNNKMDNGFTALDEKVNNVRQGVNGLSQGFMEFRKENEISHKEIISGIKLSYSELDSRLKFLEQELSRLNQRISRLEASKV